MKYLSLEYSKFNLAFQLQFGIYEAKSERFRWVKETPFERVVLKISGPLISWLAC